MTREEKITWMTEWCAKHDLRLVLNGEVGFGRECVGIERDGHYPSYHWYRDDFEREDSNGDVWTPEDAYHKHPCVAVLGRGERAEAQLYEWLQWFDEAGFEVESGHISLGPDADPILYIMKKNTWVHMVRK